MHISICDSASKPALQECTTCCRRLFHCPLCPTVSPTVRAKMEEHINGHIKNALPFKDKIICRCRLPCRRTGHFHCPVCNRTIIRRRDMARHLLSCQHSSIPSQPPLSGLLPAALSEEPRLPPAALSEEPRLPPAALSEEPRLPPAALSEEPRHPPAALSEEPRHPPAALSEEPRHPPAALSEEPRHPPAALSEEPRLPPAALSEEPRLPPAALCPVSRQSSEPLVEHSYALPSVLNETVAYGKSIRMKCPHCGLSLLKKNLKAHMMRRHSNRSLDVYLACHLQCVCVDETTGLFAVQRTGHGFSVPVHVQRKTWGRSHSVRCELEECQQYQLLAQRSGLGYSLCEHIRSLDYCRETVKEVFLQEAILMEMVVLKFFGKDKAAACLRRQTAAQMTHVPLCVRVDFGGSSSQICFSVLEPEIHSFCRLGRIFVTYNAQRNTWHCACAKPRISCPHKSIAKWHLFQTERDLFQSNVPLSSGPPSLMTQEGSSCEDNAAAERSIRYIFKEKKIPQSLPEDVMSQKMEHQRQLIPFETLCQVCPDYHKLDEAVLITNKARIVSMMGMIENVSTYHRLCPQCHMVYRYQEWTDGLHNFDNHIVLSLELCLFLRENLQNHVSVSRVIDSLEGLRRVKFPSRDIIFHGYCHFEALTDTDYMYSCINCGFHPPVVVMDLHRKGVFNLAVSDLKAPPEDFSGEHDIEGFWSSIHLEMISREFFPSSVKNPFSVPPTYTHWAPWIGSETRKSDIVLNTEFKKVRTSSSHEAQLSSVTEERLFDELTKQKVGVVRKLCKACNIDSKGSRFDLITRLREKMKSRQTYDKVFQSIWGASGGWSVILCPHGIVYSIKFNLRAESPRDFADLLLSWKHIPNICVYDFARGLVAHTNLRVPNRVPFHPHEGRLAEPTEENVKAARDGKLRVNLPWLHERMDSVNENPHPITGSSDHHVLYDRFHEGNTKDPKDILRRIQLVPELKGWLNSQVVEQFFASMRKNNYFLNNMSPSTHVFLMRNIIHHHNTVTNKKLLERQLRHGRLGQINISLSALGQAVVALQCSKPRETTETVLNQAPSISEPLVPVDDKKSNRTSTDATLPDLCGPPCKALTKPENILASRSSWSFVLHPGQQQLLNYVLDISRPKDELIVETSTGCLTRADFWTLGLNEQMESTVGNGCFELITKIVQSKGISIYIENLYVTRTWLAPYGCDPLQSVPTDAQWMDIIVLPLWTPGHFQLCVLKPRKREILFLDPLNTKAGFGGQQYVSLLRSHFYKLV
ncbi:uncharacterized protein [Paramormyrops kingsleyae]|uniref:uncharacterized protein n=1 Tax=Paramormyrops kingsleyae TaxID=1676925 RepID=UPI003B96C6DD